MTRSQSELNSEKKHTAQSAGKRKWQVAIYSFESDW